MRRLLFILLAGLFASPLYADDAFTWVDDEGVVHYSQWMPAKIDGVTRLRVSRTQRPDYDPLADPYSIRNQAERMRETWEKTEGRRAERRKLREEAAERAARQQPVYYYPYYPAYPNYYYPPVVRPPVVRPPVVRPPIHPPVRPVGPGFPNRIQRRQITGLRKFNAQPHLRVPYSAVTGVSQRATIHRSPTVSPLSGYRSR